MVWQVLGADWASVGRTTLPEGGIVHPHNCAVFVPVCDDLSLEPDFMLEKQIISACF